MQHPGAKAHVAKALQNQFVVQDAPCRRLGWFWAMLLQRCPRCRTGRIFRGRFALNDPCPVCGLIFQREEGYFLGSMYTSYILSCGLLTISYCLAVALLPGWNSILLAAVALLPYLPLLPTVFRYSRVLWIYFDRAVCPGDVSAGAYEKSRLQRPSRQDGSSRLEPDRDRVGAN
jgi:uncharacterized protein (DUF983 family)